MVRLPDPDRSSVVLIGAASYSLQSPHLPPLPAIHNNLVQLAAVLTDPVTGGFAAQRCSTLLNPPDVRTVYELLQGAATDATDTLLVYYAGHGLLDARGELHLTLTGTDPEQPDTSITALPITTVKRVLADTGATHRILILDCCFSGRATDAFMGPPTEVALAQVEVGSAIIIASAPANLPALAPPGQPFTAFTGELIHLLRTGIPDTQQPMTIETLYRQLLDAADARELPRPQRRGTGTAGDLALTRTAPQHRNMPTSAGEERASDTPAPATSPTLDNPRTGATTPGATAPLYSRHRASASDLETRPQASREPTWPTVTPSSAEQLGAVPPCLATLGKGTGGVNAVAFGSNWKASLAICSNDNTVGLWRVTDPDKPYSNGSLTSRACTLKGHVICQRHGTTCGWFLPGAWDHPVCQLRDHLRALPGSADQAIRRGRTGCHTGRFQWSRFKRCCGRGCRGRGRGRRLSGPG